MSDHKDFLSILQENHQAQIAGFYNDDKTDVEKAKRNAVIEEYQDLISIYKSWKAKQSIKEEQVSVGGLRDHLATFGIWLFDGDYIHTINNRSELVKYIARYAQEYFDKGIYEKVGPVPQALFSEPNTQERKQ